MFISYRAGVKAALRQKSVKTVDLGRPLYVSAPPEAKHVVAAALTLWVRFTPDFVTDYHAESQYQCASDYFGEAAHIRNAPLS